MPFVPDGSAPAQQPTGQPSQAFVPDQPTSFTPDQGQKQQPQPGPTTQRDPGATPWVPEEKHLSKLGWNMPNTDWEIDKQSHALGLNRQVMRTIGQLESGGMGMNSYTAHSPAGAEGPMQLEPGTFAGILPKGNILNLHDNVEAGSIYMKHLVDKYHGDYVLAAGAYNMGPGGMDEFLAGKRTMPHETAVYMAHVAVALSGPDDTPVPPTKSDKTAVHIPPTPHQVESKANMDPMKAKHGFLAELGGHAELPFILLNAHNMDEQLGTGHQHFDQAMADYKKDPAGAAQIYGLNTQHTLEFYAKHDPDPMDRKFSQYLLDHPTAAAWTTFAEEFYNPMSNAEGGVFGKTLQAAHGLAQGSSALRWLTHVGSPYQAIVTRFGEHARNIIGQIGGRTQQGAKDAMNIVQQVFGTGELDEGMHREVGRLYQGLAADPKYAVQHAELQRRADILTKHMQQLDEDQYAAKVLNRKKAKTKGAPYLPMSGAYTHPYYDADAADVVEQLRKPGGPFQKPRAGKTYEHLDESIASGNLRDDWHISDAIYNHVKGRRGNIAFADGLRKLNKYNPNIIRFGAQFSRKPPLGLGGKQMIKASAVLPHVQSPQLNNAWIDRSLANPNNTGWLQKRASMLVGRSVASDEPIENAASAVFRNFNGVMRGLMMYNPLYHPLWNVATNASARTGAGLAETMTNYVSVLANQASAMGDLVKLVPGIGKGLGAAKAAIGQKFWEGTNYYAQSVLNAQRAAQAGAHASFGGGTTFLRGSAASVRTLPAVTGVEKLDKFMTSIGDWNKTLTFGPAGEEIFSTKLFKALTDPKGKFKMNEEDAVWSVREALGNYQNVDPNSLQTKLIFFYPWLKTNLPFWMKQFLVNPRAADAPTEAFDRQRQLSGDPREFDPTYPVNPESAYMGKDDQGGDVRWTAPLPLKDADKAMTVLDPRTGGAGPSFESREEAGEQLFAGRAAPIPGAVVNTLGTGFDSKGHEPGEYHGYEVMWDKDAHNMPMEFGQWAKSFIGQLFPVPFPYVTKNVIMQGWHAERLPEYIDEIAGMGTISHTQSTMFKKQAANARSALQRKQGHLMSRQHGANPMDEDALERQAEKNFTEYTKRMNDLQTKVGKTANIDMDAINKRLDAQENGGFQPDSGGFTPD